ncbi:MAG: DUF2062 domain-containing protein [Rhodospirillales bacterium]|nr:DUF2062 domain-containing protein [Rhodospirillales bacterium]
MTWSRRFREILWPSAGWRRSTSYLFHRVARIPGTPHFIAAGLACGAAVSCTPFVGMHFALSFVLAWLVRGSLLAAAIGTAVGNPWTFPFIWVWIYESGHWLLNVRSPVPAESVNFARFFAKITMAVLRLDVSFLVESAGPVLWPMFVGSIPTAIVVWFAIYLPIKPAVAGYQARRRLRRMRNAQENQDAPAPEARR